MADRRERSGDLLAGLLAMQELFSSEIRVAMPGIIQSFDAAKRTAVVQPALKAQVQQEDGSKSWVDLPLLLDCPVVFAGSSEYFVTFPLAEGDEVLVLFADRCIDAWWQSGGQQVQAEFRMHHLSDGFCLPAAMSQPKFTGLPDVHGTEARLTSKDGTVFAGVDSQAGTSRLVAAGAEIKASAGRIDLNGTLFINGAAYLSHAHTGVVAGGATSGGVA
jgi:hypothetical protein